MPVPAYPTIKVVFKGLVIAAVKDGSDFAEVGALIEALCHKPKLIINDMVAGTVADTRAFHPKENIDLSVEGTNRSTIEVYKGTVPFNRLATTNNEIDKNDFRWYVDIENDLHPGQEYTPKPGSLKPIFRFNNALCYAQSLSGERLMLKQGNGDLEVFGRIAEEFAANIYLDQPGSSATLKVGPDTLLTVTASQVAVGKSYVIEFDCECDLHIAPEDSDFKKVYEGLDPETPVNQQIDFRKEGEPANPQVRCIGGNISRLSEF